MMVLIVTVILGIAFAYFATQNTEGVTVTIGNLQWANIPLYIVAAVSLLLGLIVSGISGTFDWLASAFTIHDRESKLRQEEKTVDELHEKIHELEVENARLKGNVEAEEEEETERKPGFLHRLRHGLSF